MPDNAIKINNLSKYYRLYDYPQDRVKEALNPFNKRYHKKHYALRNINLTIERGDILGIVGRNGCGKSTLLKVITKVLQPNEGEVLVNGKITALLELGAGFNPEFTGIENIYFYAQVLGLSPDEIEEKLSDIIEFAELGKYLYQPVKTYSSGMKSRLGFSVAAHVEPDILVLDEVLAVGDALFRRKCYAKMKEFFNAGKTVLYVSHDVNSVNELCNRAILIHGAKILMEGTPKRVTKYYEKLLFAKNESIPEVIEEIQGFKGPDIKVKKAKTKNKECESGSYFIPGFDSKEIVKYTNAAVRITTPVIRNMDGDVVNVLVTGESYSYDYEVKFDTDASRVSFGFGIKTERGEKITGASLQKADRCIDTVSRGDSFSVKWTFRCSLLAGNYFTDNGVSEIVNGERVFLTRLVDAVVFKVASSSGSMLSGLVDLQQVIEYRKVN